MRFNIKLTKKQARKIMDTIYTDVRESEFNRDIGARLLLYAFNHHDSSHRMSWVDVRKIVDDGETIE